MFFVLLLALAAVAFVVAIVMALRTSDARDWRFELSGVIGGAMIAIGRAPWLFVGFALLSAVVPIGSLFVSDAGRSFTSITAVWSSGIIATIGAFALYVFATLAMIGAGIEALRGDVSTGRILRRALTTLPKAMLASLLYWFVVGVGMMLFFVPGVIAACTCVLVLPVLMAERGGTLDAFARSSKLTRGVRWHLFLLIVIGFFFALVMQGLFGGVLALLGGGMLSIIGYFAATALLGMLPPALVASAYHTIMTAKEGAGTSELERVFA